MLIFVFDWCIPNGGENVVDSRPIKGGNFKPDVGSATGSPVRMRRLAHALKPCLIVRIKKEGKEATPSLVLFSFCFILSYLQM